MPVSRKIRLMIVDDSIFFREFMSRSLSINPSIQVVGLASDALEAQHMIADLKPDVVALDCEMPQMRGPDFLRSTHHKFPDVRFVAISSNPKNVFEALQAGAVDFVTKPNAQAKIDNAAFIQEAISKIKIAAFSTAMPPQAPPSSIAASAVARAAQAQILTQTVVASASTPAQQQSAIFTAMPASITVRNPKAVIAIGASTGGTEAILAVVRDLPANTPGIVIVQHMPPVFTKMYAERLDKSCKMRVKEAQNGDRLGTGLILLAAGDKHMRLKNDVQGYYVKCEEGEKVSGHCPSVDVLFESVAQCGGANAIGVILTGMGADGAKNMMLMKKAGAYTIGQDQESCVVYGMPMMAFKLGGVTEQLPLAKIPAAIIRKLTSM